MTLDWSSIRPLNGGREKGFEELCAQLARGETPTGGRFERKGTPDGGVECYAVLADGSEWGWQAKYFDAFGDPQWSQLEKSVTAALEKHPRLVRYFICVPLDRPDARIDGQKSAKDKWNERVEKWTTKASEKGMTVEFVYWGSHELLDRLTRPEHVGRVRFWFDKRGFDAPWFTARLDEALRTAGPRYTPEVHVDLPIALDLEAFGRTDRFFDREKARARALREELTSLGYSKGPADQAIDAAVTTLSETVHALLTRMGAIYEQPTGQLPFQAMADQVRAAEQTAEALFGLLNEREREFDANPEPADPAPGRTSYRSNPFRERRIRLVRLASNLATARKAFIDADRLASRTLFLLRGGAGTGKTHLLCDIARTRIAAGRPTVLLMGQRFVSNDAPWSQILQQLDLSHLSAEEFVGALEAAAQVAGSRALVMIDAINEGAGRTIWPSHLSAFLASLERSDWVGLVLSVRSSYEELILPAEVRAHAAQVTHQGFMEHEYDATRTFFVFYGLELPSTPLLAPEFRNPLFLKTLCRGLHAKGECRLPRGYHGISAVFDMYLTAVNERLASNLDFDKRTPLVRQALDAVARAILDTGKPWLTLGKAKQIVNAFLPGRDSFERSLYRGLVVEGVLVEEVASNNGMTAEEVVFVGYERFADHLAAKTLLDGYLDGDGLSSASAKSALLSLVGDEKHVSPGLLEALCIQVPERTGKELTSIAPSCVSRWGFGDAFRQSLVWRAYSAFSDDTRGALSELCRTRHDLDDTIDVLLTVAALPEHPFNAQFLDKKLRRHAMPDRDAWWSVYLHDAWGTHGAVDRLVDWASALDPTATIDREAVDLCALALAWMLTSSNRFLRDRATKALVSLLTGRSAAVVQLVDRFAESDDPYLIERVYAVAYGVAMRTHEPTAVGAVAARVYDRVFASGNPPPHILLRDYARGVVERALHLGSAIDVLPERIRPPYKSTWPTIPTEEDIKPLLPDWSKGSHDSGDLEWGRNRIGMSVMEDDFARYVIGTNSSLTSGQWLSLRLDESPWEAPPRPQDLLRDFVGSLSLLEKDAWGEYHAADMAYATESFLARFRLATSAESGEEEVPEQASQGTIADQLDTSDPLNLMALGETRTRKLDALKAALTAVHLPQLERILDAQKNHEAGRPPRFGLREIQRYVLKRVFDLGWTTERFGRFDRFSIGYNGREESKPERIGKKYQWIAYHEILAFISDRFQYREEFREEEGDKAYEGPWQDHLRDIDPSCTLKSLPKGREDHGSAWWEPARYNSWGHPNRPRDWVLSSDDLPRVEDLLIVTNPRDGSRWLNGQCHLDWKQPLPADQGSGDVERREIWYNCSGYLVRAEDAQLFLTWAEGVDFWGRWMPDPVDAYRLFLGEHPWAPAARYFQQQFYGNDGWTQPNHECPVKIRAVAFDYLREGGYDCSIDESYRLRLPVSELAAGLQIRWSGRGADFVDSTGQIVAQDPAAYAHGPRALLLREDPLRRYLEREGLTICWAVLGEKRVFSPGFRSRASHSSLRLSGAYSVSAGRPLGFAKYLVDAPERKDEGKGRSAAPEVIRIVRTGA